VFPAWLQELKLRCFQNFSRARLMWKSARRLDLGPGGKNGRKCLEQTIIGSSRTADMADHDLPGIPATAKAGGHPIHRMLIRFPIALLVAAMVAVVNLARCSEMVR
jgi:hypothetical protein